MTIGWIITGALVGSISAFIFNLILRLISNRAEKKAATKELVADVLDSALEEAIQYWGGKLNSQPDKKILSETKIKLLIKYQVSLIDDFVEQYSRKLSASDTIKLSSFKNEAFDLVTGGEFEGSSCKDLHRCKKIAILYAKALIIIKRCS
ncbi:MAG: hypothetical protein CMF12_13175 [Idiomarina sp.]|uniref:hypothetical protein n=1 Tax=Idiomarina sp. TaxID=1874361 RepID=UPI000C6A49EA|nr:hypothetical protein [Idiomarina sp.]MBT43462.1 hypothetical protein [Idiomarina sp.]